MMVAMNEEGLADRLREPRRTGPHWPLPATAGAAGLHSQSRWRQTAARHAGAEDKIVQSALAEVLSTVYEADFLGFSYGFRPGRNPHQALSALHTALMSQRVNWVLDADIRSFFDSVDHEWLLRMLAHRIADPRVLRLVRQWLEAGVLESDEWYETEVP